MVTMSMKLMKLKPVTFKIGQFLYNYGIQEHKLTNNLVKRMLPKKVTFVNNYFILSGLLSAFVWSVKKEDSEDPPPPPPVLGVADNLFETGHYEDCYKLLAKAENNDNVEIQWRICRTLYNLSKETKYDKKYQQSLICKAFELISKQLIENNNHYAVHKWYALLLDAKSALEGTKERIKQLENVKMHMDLAVKLNPNDATLLYMLGEWCYQITEMPWHQRKIAEIVFASPPYSSYEDALEYFLKAESVQPRFYSLNLLRIGSCYLKLEKPDQAKYYLQLAASYPATSNDDHQACTEAAELIKKLKIRKSPYIDSNKETVLSN